jgi:hypothetical protein
MTLVYDSIGYRPISQISISKNVKVTVSLSRDLADFVKDEGIKIFRSFKFHLEAQTKNYHLDALNSSVFSFFGTSVLSIHRNCFSTDKYNIVLYRTMRSLIGVPICHSCWVNCSSQIGDGEKMILSLLVIPMTFSVGFLVGRRAHHRIGMTISAAVGAVAYLVGVIILTEPLMTFPIHTFNLSTQILMAVFGALCSLFGWYIGANLDFLRGKNPGEPI